MLLTHLDKHPRNHVSIVSLMFSLTTKEIIQSYLLQKTRGHSDEQNVLLSILIHSFLYSIFGQTPLGETKLRSIKVIMPTLHDRLESNFELRKSRIQSF